MLGYFLATLSSPIRCMLFAMVIFRSPRLFGFLPPCGGIFLSPPRLTLALTIA